MHYAWIILISCCLIQVGGLGILGNCLGLYLTPVCEGLNISTASFSLYLTIQGLSMAATMTFCGKLIERFGVRKTLLVANVMAAVLYAGFSQAQSVWHFYICGIILGPVLNLAMILPVPILITSWFEKKQGLAMGIAMAFAGVSGAVFNIALAGIIASAGWRSAYMAMGVIAFVAVFPVTLFLLKDSPAKKGLLPYGKGEISAKAEQASDVPAEEVSGISSEGILKRPVFWMALMVAAIATYGCTYVTFLSSYGTSLGYATVASGTFLSAAMIGNMVSSLLLGVLVDRLGVAKVEYLSSALIIGALALLIFGNGSYAVLLLASTLFGVSSAVYSTLIPLFVEGVFGKKSYTTIYSYIVTGMTLVSSLGCVLIGWLYDFTGGYAFGFTTAIVAYGIVIALCLVLFRKKAN